MNNIKSFLSSKYNEKVFTYDMIGTNSMILYKQASKELYVVTHSGVLLTKTYIPNDLTYEKFINQAQEIYKATLEKSNYMSFEYNTSLS